MAEIINMPKLSDTMTVGTLVSWLKNEGDAVESGDILAEVETDKATMEVECFDDGVLLKHYASPGDEIPIGGPLCAIGEEGEEAPEPSSSEEDADGQETTDEDDGDDSETQEETDDGDDGKQDKSQETDSSDKSDEESAEDQEAQGSGSAEKAPEGPPDAEQSTDIILGKDLKQDPASEEDDDEEDDFEDGPQLTSSGRIKASPVARRLADEIGISLETIKGTGPGGRIVKNDVLKAVETASQKTKGKAAQPKEKDQPAKDKEQEQAPAKAKAPSKPSREEAISKPEAPAKSKEKELLERPKQQQSGPIPVSQYIAEDQSLPISNMRSVIARRLVESKNTIPHFYLETEIDAKALLDLRQEVNGYLADLPAEKGGIKFTINDFIMKACAEALRREPAVNRSWMGDSIQQHGTVNLAFGVAVDDGLVTPVIRDAQAKGLRQISIEAKDLIERARVKKIKPEEMAGSTFTITNLGMYGITSFYGVINPPNAAILSVGATVRKAIVTEAGDIVPGYRMTIGISGDHRTIDGAIGARFLSILKQLLEAPSVILV